jgi:hypothetical protein
VLQHIAETGLGHDASGRNLVKIHRVSKRPWGASADSGYDDRDGEGPGHYLMRSPCAAMRDGNVAFHSSGTYRLEGEKR